MFKSILGLDIDLNINVDMDAIRNLNIFNLDFTNLNFSVSASMSISAGISAQEATLFSLTGSDTPVGELTGAASITDQESGNYSGCLAPIVPVCAGYSDTRQGDTKTSKSLLFGTGAGVDISTDLWSGELEIVKVNTGDGPSFSGFEIISDLFTGLFD